MIRRNDSITTTRGDMFTGADHMVLAALIFDRFGRNLEVATEKWRRMLGNDTSTNEFEQLAAEGMLLSRVVRKLWNENVTY